MNTSDNKLIFEAYMGKRKPVPATTGKIRVREFGMTPQEMPWVDKLKYLGEFSGPLESVFQHFKEKMFQQTITAEKGQLGGEDRATLKRSVEEFSNIDPEGGQFSVMCTDEGWVIEGIEVGKYNPADDADAELDENPEPDKYGFSKLECHDPGY